MGSRRQRGLTTFAGNVAMGDATYIGLSNAAVAAAGSGQSTYTQIADQLNGVTGADGTKGVALPAASAGQAIFILNTGQTSTLKVSPVNGGNDTINSLTAGTGVFTMGPARGAWFVPTSGTQWYVTGDAAIVGTPTEQDMDGLTASMAELNLNATAVAGAATASKTAVYDSAGKLYRSSASPAAAGTSVTDATALTAEFNYVTGSDGTVGVVLPVAAANEIVTVVNSVTTAGNSLKVYAVTGSQINALGSTVAFVLNPGQTATFIGRSATLWNAAPAAVTSAKIAEEVIQFVQVTLSSANILAMSATPVSLIAAQGAGKIIVVDDILLKMVTSATAYANGGAVEFRYTNGSGAKVTADIAAAVVTAGAGTSYTKVKGIEASLTAVDNAAIVITNATAAFITGTGTGVLSITYRVVTA